VRRAAGLAFRDSPKHPSDDNSRWNRQRKPRGHRKEHSVHKDHSGMLGGFPRLIIAI